MEQQARPQKLDEFAPVEAFLSRVMIDPALASWTFGPRPATAVLREARDKLVDQADEITRLRARVASLETDRDAYRKDRDEAYAMYERLSADAGAAGQTGEK